MRVEKYQKILSEHLSPKRIEHSLCVSREAARLAKKYGADEEQAELAGLLHDIMKEAPRDEQLDMIKKDGITLNAVMMASPKLWHAIAGAAFCRLGLGIRDEEVLSAIRYHTSGRGGMTLLEKVIFIADFTSADRDYKEIAEMRAAADHSLRAAIKFALCFTIADLARHGRVICPDTIDLYNETIMDNSHL